MTQTRNLLLVALLAIGYFLWDAWQRDYASPPPLPTADQLETATVDGDDGAVPLPPSGDAAAVPAPPAVDGAPRPADAQGATAGEGVVVTTDVLELELDASGGTLRRADLLQHRVSTDEGAPPVRLLSNARSTYYVAESGLVSNSNEAPSHNAPFAAAARRYTLGDADALEVPFVWTGPDGLEVRRIYRLQRSSYAIDVRYEIVNRGETVWQGNAYRQLQRVAPPAAERSMFSSPETFSFTGMAWYSPADKFDKLAYDDFADEPIDRTVTGGWTAMLQHYFLTAWVPPADAPTQLSTEVRPNPGGAPRYLVRQIGPRLQVAPGATLVNEARLYVGPKQQDQLETTAPGLELSVDYGIFTILAQPLFWLLSWLYRLFGNWGWAIIGLVVIIKLAFFKLSETQFKSFAKMRRVQPRIEALKERYGDDRQKFQMAMMELYKKEKINPMGGCLPILVQIPVFIALYWVLVESVELRHAPWFGWITNLNARDPYFILPILNMVAMFLTQRLSPAPGMDPIQKKMMQAMPLVFGVLFAFFPAGLVLYWATNGWLGLLQQWYIMRRHGEPPKPA